MEPDTRIQRTGAALESLLDTHHTLDVLRVNVLNAPTELTDEAGAHAQAITSALEAISEAFIEPEPPMPSPSLESEADVSSKLSSIGERTVAVMARIYKAIVAGIKWLINLFTGAQATMRYKRQYVEKTLEPTKAQLQRFVELGVTRKPRSAMFQSLRLNQHLAIGGTVKVIQLISALKAMKPLTQDVRRYAVAQNTYLTKAVASFAAGSLDTGDLAVAPRPGSLRVKVSAVEASVRGFTQYHVLAKTEELPGNKALLHSAYAPGTTVGNLRGSAVTDAAPPYVGGKFGISFNTFSPELDLNRNVMRAIPVAMGREMQELMRANLDLFQDYKYLESEFEGLLDSYAKHIKTFERPPASDEARLVGYLRNYVIGNAAEVTNLITQYSRYMLETIFQIAVYVRSSLSQYPK